MFDTTQNSWHGLPDPILCPCDVSRNSMAIYYLSEPREGIETHDRALFVPYKEQNNDPKIVEFAKERSKTK